MHDQPLSLKLPDVPNVCYFFMHLWFQARYATPAFYGWSIYQEQSKSDIRVRFRQYRGISEPAQRIQSEELIPDQVAIREFIERGQEIHIPVVGVRNGSGKDGALCGIVFPAPVPEKHNRITWFSRGPHQWRELTHWYFDFIRFLEEL